MEFPDLGVHCQSEGCNRLDFLPVVCSACKNKYCSDHWSFNLHNCSQKHTIDVQVPVCPLCDKPVPTAKGASPDDKVSAHIDRDCQSDPAKAKRGVFRQRCSVKKCKQKEMIKVECDQCKKNFCLKHRHPLDHQCQGKNDPNYQSKAGQAALNRQQQVAAGSSSTGLRQTTVTNRLSEMFQRQQNSALRMTVSDAQGRMSEDEALARALQESMNHEGRQNREPSVASPTSQEEQDRMLAEAIARSEQEASRNGGQSSNAGGKSCEIS